MSGGFIAEVKEFVLCQAAMFALFFVISLSAMLILAVALWTTDVDWDAILIFARIMLTVSFVGGILFYFTESRHLG